MRYSSALVLGTMAIGQAAASNNVRHASFHARRNAETKRGAADVDWQNVAYDFSDVDFKTVDYSGGKTTTTAAAVPAASSPPEVQPAPPAPSQAETTAAAAAPSKTAEASSGGDVAGDVTAGIEDFEKSLGVKAGANSKSKSAGGIWIGDDGSYKATFTNDGDKTAALICWGTATMRINVSPPPIFVTIGGGQQVTVSLDEGFSGGCGAAFSDSVLVDGLLNESILEFTAKSGPGEGCFDISREINMKGVALSAKGSKCTSGLAGDALSCTFVCTNGADKCGQKGEYDIALGSATAGNCMIGEFDGAPSGGCLMSGPGEHMQVTIFGHRNWPSA